MRARCVAVVIAGILGCLAAPAHADPRAKIVADIAAKTRAAMASYDAMDYDTARRLLNQALAIAKKARLDKDPIVARVYLDLGITQLATAEHEAARVAFLSAAQIDPRITVEPAYRSPDVVKLLDEARAVVEAEDPLELRDPGGPGELGAAAADDPLAPRAGAGAGGPASRVTVAIAGGTGLGYVTGRTESDNVVQTCCVGSSPVVVGVELAYHASAQLAIGLAGRAGFPIGANVMGHATIAPAGFLRVRYALSPSGDGLRVMGEIGGGILRNTIKLDNVMPGMNTDIVAQGPLLVGAGIGFSRRMSRNIVFQVDLDVITGVAIVEKLGDAVLNSGISADMSLGVAFGF
jgi:hypothetical protein